MNQQTSQTKKRTGPYIAGDNIVETVRGIGAHVGKTVIQDVVSKIAGDALSDIVGGRRQQRQPGEFTPQERVPFPPETFIRPRPSIHELIREIAHKDGAETKQKLELIRKELAALSKSIQGLSADIQTAVMEMPVEPGVYHMNFFEQLRRVLMVLRERVDDSRTWLAAWKANAKKKQGYWFMCKKHGTSFSLSSERTLATQAG